VPNAEPSLFLMIELRECGVASICFFRDDLFTLIFSLRRLPGPL
jgi:hypothetical protein